MKKPSKRCTLHIFLYTIQILVICIAISVSVFKLFTSENGSQFWVSLLSSSVGYILPTPNPKCSCDVRETSSSEHIDEKIWKKLDFFSFQKKIKSYIVLLTPRLPVNKSTHLYLRHKRVLPGDWLETINILRYCNRKLTDSGIVIYAIYKKCVPTTTVINFSSSWIHVSDFILTKVILTAEGHFFDNTC